MHKGIVVFAIGLLGACAQGPAPSSHARMVAVLDEIAARTPDRDPYLGDAEVRALEKQLAELSPTGPALDRLECHRRLGDAILRVGGREEEAVEHLKKAVALADTMRTALRSEMRASLRFRLGVAYLRLGEVQNCCARWTPDSCVLPIRGGGIHTRPEGSQGAMEAFRRVAAATKPQTDLHRQAVWLLNIAAMTLAQHPDGVPEEYRIPPSAFVSEGEFPRFRRVAPACGVDTYSLSGGAVADDFDGDGYLDLLVSSTDPRVPVRVFRNRGDGRFEDRSESLRGIRGGLNLVHADYDNDGDLDVYLLRGAWLGANGRHPNSLLRNDGDFTFTDVTFDAGLGDARYPTQTAAWADYDHDGDLDLYVGNEEDAGQLFRNRGDGTFEDVAKAAGVTNDRFPKGVVWGDFNGDRHPDLYISNLSEPNRLYENRGDGTFRDVAVELGVAGPMDSFPAWFWDYDNDGHLDLYVSAYAVSTAPLARAALGQPSGVEPAALYRGDGRGGFVNVTKEARLDRPAFPMGANFGDLDNDGFLDFYLGTGAPAYEDLMPNAMYLNVGGKTFRDVTYAGGFGHLQKGHGVAFADFDNDGDQDVFEQMGGGYLGDLFKDALYENPGFGHRWIGVHLVGVTSNRSAIGARIRVVTDRGSVYKHVNSGGSFGANPLRQTIGLGAATRIERIEVYWPTTDRTQTVRDVAPGRAIRITEGREGYDDLNLKPFRLGGAPD